jgi:hypothetical protein
MTPAKLRLAQVIQMAAGDTNVGSGPRTSGSLTGRFQSDEILFPVTRDVTKSLDLSGHLENVGLIK